MNYNMDNYNLQQAQAFYRILEEAIGKLPADVRAKLYRPCAVNCVKDVVLAELRRQFEEWVYEIGYPRCLCPQVDAGFVVAPTHCECSRQSILFVYEELIPDKTVRVETLGTVLEGASECRFRVVIE